MHVFAWNYIKKFLSEKCFIFIYACTDDTSSKSYIYKYSMVAALITSLQTFKYPITKKIRIFEDLPVISELLLVNSLMLLKTISIDPESNQHYILKGRTKKQIWYKSHQNLQKHERPSLNPKVILTLIDILKV